MIKNNLLISINTKEMYLNYQPIVDVNINKAIVFEDLARWNSSEVGQILPLEFVSIAEKDSTIHVLGEFIIDRAAKDISNSTEELKVSINCSSRQLIENVNFPDALVGTLSKYNVNPKNIILEVTETYLVRDYKKIRDTLEQIHEYGVDVAIDDFGTGYSSLSLLANIQFQYLKIDREFVKNIHTQAGYKVLECIYNIAKSLNKKVIAEGIETKKQMEMLMEMGITLMQGYYFSKPTDIDDIKTTF